MDGVKLARQSMNGNGTSKDAWVSFEKLTDSAVSLAVSFYVPRIVDQERAKSAFLRCYYGLLQEHGLGSPLQNPVVRRAAAAHA